MKRVDEREFVRDRFRGPFLIAPLTFPAVFGAANPQGRQNTR